MTKEKTVLITEKHNTQFKAEIIENIVLGSTPTKYYYTYYIYLVHREKDYKEEAAIVKVYSAVYNESFFEELLNYYMPVINGISQSRKTVLHYINVVQCSTWIQWDIQSEYSIFNLNNPQNCEKFLRKHKNDVFTREMITEYFVLTSSLYNKANKRKELVQAHNEYYKDVETINVSDGNYDIYRYMYPAFYELTDTDLEIEYYYCFRNYNHTNIESLKLVHKVYAILLNAENVKYMKKYGDFKVSDVTVEELYKDTTIIPVNNFGLFARSIKPLQLVEYYNNLTVAQLVRVFIIFNNKCFTYKNKDSVTIPVINENIKFCEMYKDTDKTDTVDTTQSYKLLQSHVDSTMQKRSIVKNFYKKHNKYDHNTVLMVNDYLNSIGDTILTERQFNKLYNVVNRKNKYISNIEISDWLIKSLTEKLSAEEIIQLLDDVNAHGKKINAATWDKFLDNADEYKDMPVAWWLELESK